MKRIERKFNKGDWVYLNLAERFQIHLVFHVSRLKKHVGKGVEVNYRLPILGPEGKLRIEPVAILGRQLVKERNVVVPEILVKWSNLDDEDATWEEYEFMG